MTGDGRNSRHGQRSLTRDNVRRQQTSVRVPPSVQAEVIGLRKLGLSYRQIAERTGRDKNTVMKILRSPDAQRELSEDADQILSQYRQRALGMVPEALDTMETLIAQGDRFAVAKLLYGTQVLTPRTEQVIEQRQDKYANRTDKDLEYFTKHGCWPDEQSKPN